MSATNEELRPIVEAALGPDCSFASINVFKAKISPAKVKAMLDQIDALTALLIEAKNHIPLMFEGDSGSCENLDGIAMIKKIEEYFAALESVGVKL